jgi:hypothetical protein
MSSKPVGLKYALASGLAEREYARESGGNQKYARESGRVQEHGRGS